MEKSIQMFRGDGFAGIGDGEAEVVLDVVEPDCDSAFGTVVFDGIANEVEQHLFEPVGVT